MSIPRVLARSAGYTGLVAGASYVAGCCLHPVFLSLFLLGSLVAETVMPRVTPPAPAPAGHSLLAETATRPQSPWRTAALALCGVALLVCGAVLTTQAVAFGSR